MKKKLILILLLFVLGCISVSLGVKAFSWAGLLSGQPADRSVFWLSRLPRLISILITGAGLSISGLILQTITGNKFVSPAVAGTMDWCRLGILLAIILAGSQQTWLKLLLAFVVSLAGTLLFLTLLRQLSYQGTYMVPLIGLMLGLVVSSVTSLIAYRFDVAQNLQSWLQGSFSLIIEGRYELLYLGLPCLLLAYLYAARFTVAGMGEATAVNLGLNYKAATLAGLTLTALMTSAILVTVGSIAFVGLIIPNLVSIWHGDHIRHTMFETAALGSIFLLSCDLISRTLIYPHEIPISVTAGIIGAGVFLALILRRRRRVHGKRQTP